MVKDQDKQLLGVYGEESLIENLTQLALIFGNNFLRIIVTWNQFRTQQANKNCEKEYLDLNKKSSEVFSGKMIREKSQIGIVSMGKSLSWDFLYIATTVFYFITFLLHFKSIIFAGKAVGYIMLRYQQHNCNIDLTKTFNISNWYTNRNFQQEQGSQQIDKKY